MLLRDVLHILADFGKEIGINHGDLYIRLFNVEDLNLEQTVKNLFLSRALNQTIYKEVLTDEGFVNLCLRIKERYLAPIGKHYSLYNVLCKLIEDDNHLSAHDKQLLITSYNPNQEDQLARFIALCLICGNYNTLQESPSMANRNKLHFSKEYGIQLKHYIYDFTDSSQSTDEKASESNRSSKLFISHSTQDKQYVSCLVNFLKDLGLSKKQLFCSSVPGYDIPLGKDIYNFLKLQFEMYNLHVIFVLSENYYQSVACMNEMGASWILQNKYTTILLPGFEFKEIQGAINPRQIGLKLDNDITDIKEKLNQFKNILFQEFCLKNITDHKWEVIRDTFLADIQKIANRYSND